MPEPSSYPDLTFDRAVGEVDPFVADLIDREHARQRDKLILIPSESLTPGPVREALASPFTSIYSEGYPAGPMLRDDPERLEDLDWQLARFRRYGDRRYYRGNDFSNLVESLARRRCAEIFANGRVAASNLHVNVQPLSGAAANNAVFEALLDPDDGIMGLQLSHGGHLTHGSPVSRSGIRYRSVRYELVDAASRLDYDQIAAIADRERPRIIIAGYTSYPWAPDWERFRAIADSVDAYLMADISHPAGMVVAGAYPSPVGIADVVTFTTHKTLFGPRAAVILSHRRHLMRRIDRAVFPGEQGGPHVNKMAAMAVAFGLAATPAFAAVQRRIVDNAAVLADALVDQGVGVAYGGTDTHLLVVNLREAGASGELRGEPTVRILDLLGIVANRNSLPGDSGFAAPSGVRMGTPWLTQRGFDTSDMRELAGLLGRAFRAMIGVTYPGKRGARHRGRIEFAQLRALRAEVAELASRGAAERARPAPVVPERAALIEVRGPRAPQFVDELSNRRVRDLASGAAAHVGVGAPPGGEAIPALVVRPETDRRGHERRMWLIVNPAAGSDAAEWLQAASDGYVVVDRADPSRKLTGPVAVTPGPGAREPLDAIPISAVDAARLAPDGGSAVAKIELDGRPALVLRDGEAAAVVADATSMAELAGVLGARNISPAAVPNSPAADVRRPFFAGRSDALPKTGPERRPAFAWTEPSDASELLETPLHDWHAERSRMVPFAGWHMPVWYEGIEAEHRAVRTAAGLFDVGHMGVFGIGGPHAAEFLDLVVTGTVSRVPIGRALYTYLLDPTGHCLDDLIVYRLTRDRFLAVVNASNADKDWAWLRGVNEREFEIEPGDPWAERPVAAELENLKDPDAGDRRRVDLALQGKHSRAILQRIAGSQSDAATIAAMRSNDVRTVTLGRTQVEVACTGYTGERTGFEIFVHPQAAADLWEEILTAGAEDGVKPCGLGARDSTRTEAGFPLYGHELGGDLDLTPGDAGFGSFVKVHKSFFIGRRGFAAREAARQAEIVRFRVTDEPAPIARPGDPVMGEDGATIGSVTSATLALDRRQIGMAHVARPSTEPGTPLAIHAGAARRRRAAPAGRERPAVHAKVISRFRR